MSQIQWSLTEALRDFRSTIDMACEPGKSAPRVVHRAAMERALASASLPSVVEELRGPMDEDVLHRLNERNLERARSSH